MTTVTMFRYLAIGRVAPKWLEVDMPMSRKAARGSKAYAAPLFGIGLLMTFYWLMTDWHDLPAVISTALAAVHWPT